MEKFKKEDFQRLNESKSKKTINFNGFRLILLKGDFKVGVIVSSKLAKAHKRNRIRRKIFEYFKKRKTLFKKQKYLFIFPNKGSISMDIEDELEKALGVVLKKNRVV